MSRYVRRKKPAAEKSRLWALSRLIEKYGGNCYLCHRQFESKKDITIDHLVPRSKGGKDEISNLRLSHLYCNKAKRDLTIEEFAVLQEGF